MTLIEERVRTWAEGNEFIRSRVAARMRSQHGMTSKVMLSGDARVRRTYEAVSAPIVTAFVLNDDAIHPDYGMDWNRKVELARRLYRAKRRVRSGTAFSVYVTMAAKILSIPPDVEGVVVECGSWIGGSATALSIICEYADRELVVYDSFEGLPEPEPEDALAKPGSGGFFRGELEVVKANVRRHGVIDRCSFRKGWFEDTLPHHQEPVVAAYVDVDFQASLHDCVRYLWPHLVEGGHLFLDEFTDLRYCALFWSERWWRTYLDDDPPGLFGSGSGIPLGNYWIGPETGKWGMSGPRAWQQASSVAYALKGASGHWGYYPTGKT